METERNFFTYLLLALRDCATGIPLTLQLMGYSVAAGLLLALPLAVVYARKTTFGARLVGGFTYFFTGTPLLVQMYIFYKGMPEFEWVRHLMQEPGFEFMQDGFIWAWLSFTLNTAAYSIVIFGGAIRNTPHGDIEAARAYGWSKRDMTWRLIMPSSLRRALPAYTNEVVMMLQSTSLASVVTLYEVTGKATDFNSQYYQPFPAFIAAGIIYLIMTTVLVAAFRRLEKRYLAHLRLAGSQ